MTKNPFFIEKMKKSLVQLALNPFFGWFRIPENPISCIPDPSRNLPSSYFAERNLKRGVTLFPYWGLFRLLHQPLNVLYLLVWSHGKVFSSKVQDSRDEAGTTLVTSMLVKPSAKSSMLTFIRLPVTCLLIRVLLGLMKQKKGNNMVCMYLYHQSFIKSFFKRLGFSFIHTIYLLL